MKTSTAIASVIPRIHKPPQQQRYRTSGLNLVTAAIVLWNTVYLDRAIQALQSTDVSVDPELFQHLSPLGWEHVNLTGNYTWRNPTKPGRYRPLRQPPKNRLSVVQAPFSQTSPANVLAELQRQGYTRVKHVTGGVLAWVNEIEPTKPVY